MKWSNENGDLSMTCKSTSIFEQVPLSPKRLNASLQLVQNVIKVFLLFF